MWYTPLRPCNAHPPSIAQCALSRLSRTKTPAVGVLVPEGFGFNRLGCRGRQRRAARPSVACVHAPSASASASDWHFLLGAMQREHGSRRRCAARPGATAARAPSTAISAVPVLPEVARGAIDATGAEIDGGELDEIGEGLLRPSTRTATSLARHRPFARESPGTPMGPAVQAQELRTDAGALGAKAQAANGRGPSTAKSVVLVAFSLAV